MAFGVCTDIHRAYLLTHSDQPASRITASHADQFAWLGVWQREKKNPAHQTENGRIGPDSQSQREHCDGRESQTLAQQPQAITNILKYGVHDFRPRTAK